MLSVRNLYAGYGKLRVLFDVSVEVPEKEITVVVGPNGAGKTTLLNSIMGIADVFSGSIIFEGRDITRTATHKLAKMGIAYVPQMGNVFAELSVLENLRLAGYPLGKEELRDRIGEVTEMFPVLKRFLHRKAGT
ncbi:ABC transporter ATP-binding protein, partial [Candidatus Bathyarchaeota archaeon]